ncbi:MAG: polyprenyl synthetase family protein [Verrucomicrobiota bacterium]
MVPTQDKAQFPFEIVREHLAAVESAIAEQARSFDPAVEGYVQYVCDTSGKRIRPALAILAGGATGAVTEDHIKLGVILELIHLATLVHDDIIDGADIRREVPTANAKWGPSLSVLLGDALFAHALTLATEYDDLRISRAVARASTRVCTGEIIQTQRRFDLQLSTDDYFRIIEMKTAELFAVASEMGAYFNGASDATVENLRAYGMELGTAYQIYDDCLDLVGEEEAVGKTLRTDLIKGKLTLPVLNLLADATPSQTTKLNRLILEREPIDLSVLAGIADYAGAIEKSVTTARELVTSAESRLIGLADNDSTAALRQVAAYLDALLDRCAA